MTTYVAGKALQEYLAKKDDEQETEPLKPETSETEQAHPTQQYIARGKRRTKHSGIFQGILQGASVIENILHEVHADRLRRKQPSRGYFFPTLLAKAEQPPISSWEPSPPEEKEAKEEDEPPQEDFEGWCETLEAQGHTPAFDSFESLIAQLSSKTPIELQPTVRMPAINKVSESHYPINTALIYEADRHIKKAAESLEAQLEKVIRHEASALQNSHESLITVTLPQSIYDRYYKKQEHKQYAINPVTISGAPIEDEVIHISVLTATQHNEEWLR